MDLKGFAKGIGYQLVENLGNIERKEIAQEVKELDQDMRATLRRYGVRFGTYYIYIPALLKAKALSTLNLTLVSKMPMIFPHLVHQKLKLKQDLDALLWRLTPKSVQSCIISMAIEYAEKLPYG